MGLNLKDEETVALVSELARRLGRSKTATVRQLARDKLIELDSSSRLTVEVRRAQLEHFLETEIRPFVKPGPPITKEEIERLTGMDDMERQWS